MLKAFPPTAASCYFHLKLASNCETESQNETAILIHVQYMSINTSDRRNRLQGNYFNYNC